MKQSLLFLDAIFNYWGEDGPNTVGRVAIFPLLPEPSDTIIGYMGGFGLNALDAISYASLLAGGASSSDILAALALARGFAFSADQLLLLIEEYGKVTVSRALRLAGGDYDMFLALLVGYAVGDGGGGGGGCIGGGGGGADGTTFVVGDTIPLEMQLFHPITGEPITDALVSYSVCRTLPDGTAEIVLLGVMAYDGDLAAYTFELDTSSMEPGVYDVYLGSNDGRSQHFQIEVAAE